MFEKFSAIISSNMPLSQTTTLHLLGLSLKARQAFSILQVCYPVLQMSHHFSSLASFWTISSTRSFSSTMYNLLIRVFTEFLNWVIVFFSCISPIWFFLKCYTFYRFLFLHIFSSSLKKTSLNVASTAVL